MHNTIVLLKVACTSSLHKPYISPQKHRLSQLQSIEYSEILSSVDNEKGFAASDFLYTSFGGEL